MTTYKGYEMVIGLEVHAELSTKSKIFCSCPTQFGAEPNTQCCPVCMGMPGTLPVLNESAVEYAVRAGLATKCEIAELSKFDRKNYFYPDLPKGYQISQFDMPICTRGHIEIESESEKKRVRITRIHLEEDAGKLIHMTDGGEVYTLVDCNRCGVPLIEIVSEPDISSADEAKSYLRKLRAVLMFTAVSDCRMNEGSFRCDVNLSVRKVGGEKLGVRTEIKNLNSFAFVGKAIESEFKRQVDAIESGEQIVQETRRFDPDSGKTFTMRKKEDADDYRYFPEPDLPPVRLSAAYIDAVRAKIPPLPDERKEMYVAKWGISPYNAEQLTQSISTAEYFESVAALTDYAKSAANIIIGELLKTADEDSEIAFPRTSAAEIAQMSETEIINSNTAKRIIKMISAGDARSPKEIVTAEGMGQINDAALLRAAVEEAAAANLKAVADMRSGKDAARKSIVGYVMKKTNGYANPRITDALVDEIAGAM
jgi:aspartyl/glutamyl-tRNA(Asn/Gln) amidotransferase, B subunit